MELKTISLILIVVVVAIVVIGFIIKKAIKIKKKTKETYAGVEEEFESGKILLPIDKRDFEDLEEFKEKTKHIPKIRKKLETLEEDFNKLEFVEMVAK